MHVARPACARGTSGGGGRHRAGDVVENSAAGGHGWNGGCPPLPRRLNVASVQRPPQLIDVCRLPTRHDHAHYALELCVDPVTHEFELGVRGVDETGEADV